MCMITCAYVYVMCNHLCVEGGEKREREWERSRKCAGVMYTFWFVVCMCMQVSVSQKCVLHATISGGHVETCWTGGHIMALSPRPVQASWQNPPFLAPWPTLTWGFSLPGPRWDQHLVWRVQVPIVKGCKDLCSKWLPRSVYADLRSTATHIFLAGLYTVPSSKRTVCYWKLP